MPNEFNNSRPLHVTPTPISVSRWSADVVTSFLTFSFLGAAWGCFNPIPVPGSKAAMNIARTGKFVPLPVFSSAASIGYYGATIGSVAAVHRFVSGGIAVATHRQSAWNELLGLGAIYVYWRVALSSETRLRWNNRVVSGVVLGSVIYANLSS